MEKTIKATVEGRCIVCNEVCFPRSTPTEEVSNDASIYIAFSHLGMDGSQLENVFPDGVENVKKLCEECKSKLTNSFDAPVEVAKELKELENKVDLAISQLQTISDLPREGGALLFHHGVINASLKLGALKDVLKTAQLGVNELHLFRNIVSTIQLPVVYKEETSSNSSNNFSPVPNIFPENEAKPCTNQQRDKDNGEGALGNKTQVGDDDFEITIGPVFRNEVRVEPRDKDQSSSSSEDSEVNSVVAEVKIDEPRPEIVKILKGRSTYRTLEKHTSILKGSVPPGADTSASSSDVHSPVTHELIIGNIETFKTETSSKLETKMKRELSDGAGCSPVNKGIIQSRSQTCKIVIDDEDADDNLCNQLCQAVKDTDLDKIKSLVFRKDVQKVIEKSISKEKWRSTRLDNVARLVITCAESTLYDDQEIIEKKKELINYLIGVNKNLLFSISKTWKGSWNLNNTLEDKYSPLLRLNVHPDLILFLLNLTLEASTLRRRAAFIETPLSDRIEIFVKSFERGFSRLPKGGSVASLGSYLESRGISEEQYKWMTEASCRCLNRVMDPEGNTLLSQIIRHNIGVKGIPVIETVKNLTRWGASITWRGRETKESLLHLAARKGEVEVVEYFLETSPILASVLDKKGFNPLDSIVWEIIAHKKIICEEHFEHFLTIAKKLVQVGGKFARLYEIKRKMLHLIANPEGMDQAGLKTEFLCRLGLHVNQVDDFGNSPLHLACESLEKCLCNPYPAIELLIELIDNFGDISYTKIIYEELVNKTLEENSCGFEEDEKLWDEDEANNEPIHNHAQQFINGLCTIRALAHFGANTTQRNGLGETPVDIINRLEIPECIKIVAKRCLN